MAFDNGVGRLEAFIRKPRLDCKYKKRLFRIGPLIRSFKLEMIKFGIFEKVIKIWKKKNQGLSNFKVNNQREGSEKKKLYLIYIKKVADFLIPEVKLIFQFMIPLCFKVKGVHWVYSTCLSAGTESKYSHLSNKRGGWNKRGGGAKAAKSINVEVGILQLESSPFVLK